MKSKLKILINYLLYILFGLFIVLYGMFHNVTPAFALTNKNTIQFYDNNGNSASWVTTNYISQIQRSEATFTTQANSFGGLVLAMLPTPVVNNHTYSIFLSVGAESNGGFTELSSKNCIGLGNDYQSAISSYINCSYTPVYSRGSGNTGDYTRGLFWIFNSRQNASYIALPYTTQYTCSSCLQYSYGIEIEDNGDYTNLSESELNSAISSQTNSIDTTIANMQSSIANSITQGNNSILQNNNTNRQAIIDNDNTNRQAIIDNQNQNTQDIINSNKVCNDIDNTDIITNNRYFDSNGNIQTSTGVGITDYISLEKSDLYVLDLTGVWDLPSTCFYNKNKILLSCIANDNLVVGKYTLPSSTSYFRSSIQSSRNVPSFKICTDGNQAVNDSINGLNDTLNNDDTDGAVSDASDFFSDFTTNTFGLTSIITAPLNLIQSLSSSTCTDLELPLPYLNNKKLILPCMTTIYFQYFGSFFIMYQTITYGIIAYWICVRIFNQVKDFKNPEHDEIEVVDL